MLALYRSLLYLYPSAYRWEYGDEIIGVLAEVQAETRKRSVLAQVSGATHEAGGLLYGALREHLRSVTGSSGGEMFLSMFLSRRFKMRSEFRFPKATVTLMTIILAVVVIAIEKAKAISASVPHASVQVGPIQTQFTIVPTLLVVLFGTMVVGVLGWAVFFAMRRSGVHRLSEMNPSTGQRSGK
jgi:hypothetical protein